MEEGQSTYEHPETSRKCAEMNDAMTGMIGTLIKKLAERFDEPGFEDVIAHLSFADKARIMEALLLIVKSEDEWRNTSTAPDKAKGTSETPKKPGRRFLAAKRTQASSQTSVFSWGISRPSSTRYSWTPPSTSHGSSSDQSSSSSSESHSEPKGFTSTKPE